MTSFEDRNIVLTGFMGTGKSTVGRRLARRLGFRWIDTDHMIEERHGPIPEIFARAGETVFRGIERNLAAELSDRTHHVISTGGRMLLDLDNIRSFSRRGRIFCLVAPTEVLVARLLRSATPRPLLEGSDPVRRIETLLEDRAPDYRRFTQIESGDRSADAVTDLLLGLITAPTAIPDGRIGFAVLPDTAVSGPVAVLTDDTVGAIHAPLVGPVDATVTDPKSIATTHSAIVVGGTDVTRHVPSLLERGIRCVVAPTTPTAMRQIHEGATRVLIDGATLQTLSDDRRPADIGAFLDALPRRT